MAENDPSVKPQDAQARARQMEEVNHILRSRLEEAEKRLREEQDKAAAAQRVTEERAATSASVETALRDAQDRRRREKREQDLEAALQAAETRARDLERRMAEEREMWVTMLKGQMAQNGQGSPELVRQVSELKADLQRKEEEAELLRRGGAPDPSAEARLKELEDQLAARDGLLEKLQQGQQELQARLTQVSAAKEAEARLMKENLQRLGRQNKELLARVRDVIAMEEQSPPAAAPPAPPSAPPPQRARVATHVIDLGPRPAGDGSAPRDPGPVTPGMHEMLGSLEQALDGRDRVLEDQQKALDEKKTLIEGLFNDLKTLDDQAVALLEEKNQATREMDEKVKTLSEENRKLKDMLDKNKKKPHA